MRQVSTRNINIDIIQGSMHSCSLCTGFPFEDRDFDTTEVNITFPAGIAEIQRINIGIVNDSINEVEQLFVIFLQVVDAVDPSRVNLESGRFATLGRILDDDRKCGSGVYVCGRV